MPARCARHRLATYRRQRLPGVVGGQRRRRTASAEDSVGAAKNTYGTEVTPVFQRYLYHPVVAAVEWLADTVRPIQSGDVNRYLLYVFVAVPVAYLLGLAS